MNTPKTCLKYPKFGDKTVKVEDESAYSRPFPFIADETMLSAIVGEDMSPHTYDAWLGYVDCRSWRGVSVRATERTSQETVESRCVVIARPMPVWKSQSVSSSILGFHRDGATSNGGEVGLRTS